MCIGLFVGLLTAPSWADGPSPTKPGTPGIAKKAIPVIKVDNPVHDFGATWTGPSIECSFTVSNVGNDKLVIHEAEPDCGCIYSTDFPPQILPGASGKFTFSLDTTQVVGPYEKTVRVTTNDPITPVITLTLKGISKQYVEVIPPSANFGTIAGYEPRKQMFRIRNNSDKPLELTMDPPPKGAPFDFQLSEKVRGQEYQVVVTTVPTQESGIYTTTAQFHTNLPQQQRAIITATAIVPPRLEAIPRAIVVDSGGSSTEAVTRTILVNNNGLVPVKVLSAAADDSRITASVSEIMAGKTYKVSVQLPARYTSPPKGNTLVIRTDDSVIASLSVPIGTPDGLASVDEKKGESRPSPVPRLTDKMVGKPAPAFELTTIEGIPVSNRDLAQAITVLNFITPKNVQCNEQVPRVVAMRAQYAGRNVRFLNVSEKMESDDLTERQIVSKMQSLAPGTELAIDLGNMVGRLFNVSTYPTMIILGKSGNVEAVNVTNGANLDTRAKVQLDALASGKPIPEVPAMTPPTPTSKPSSARPATELVGKPAPSFSLPTMGGKPISTDVMAKSSATVLDFVAPNCGFCKKQIPRVETIREEYEKKGVRFVLVSQTMGKQFSNDEAAAAFAALGAHFEVAPDAGNKVGNLYRAVSYPTLMIVGKGGKIENVIIGAKADIQTTLKQQLDTMLK